VAGAGGYLVAFLVESFGLFEEEEPIEDGGAYYTPNPDIIFHERTQQDSNILAIEVKTYYYACASVVLLDKMKLAGYLRVPTFYQNGLYLNLGFDGKQILLSEALLVKRSSLEKVDEGSPWHDHVIGKRPVNELAGNVSLRVKSLVTTPVIASDHRVNDDRSAIVESPGGVVAQNNGIADPVWMRGDPS